MGSDFAHDDPTGEPDLSDSQVPPIELSEIEDWLRISYNSATERYHATVVDGIEVPLYVLIVSAISAITNADPTELEPFGTILDPDSLHTLFESIEAESTTSQVKPSFTFEYAGCEVIVNSSSEVIISP